MLKRIAENVRRHDWFAVGIEIGVVVIGLLLAFQLDDWRGGWVERQQERGYVGRLIADVQTDVPEIEDAIALGRMRLELVDLVIRVATDPPAASATPVLFMGAISQAAYTYTPQLTSHTFENLRSTGDLRLIRDEALKDTLFGYYGFDAAQRQFRPLQFATEHRHFELGAGILSLEQERYVQEHWLFFDPNAMDAPRAQQPDVGGIPEAARRLQERPEFVAWLPYVRQMQLDQIETHGMRLERAQNVLQQLRDYAADIGDGD
jgi:hypothetical protein